MLIHTTCFYGQAIMGPFWLYDNHYLSDKYLINPAFAGYQYYPKVFVGEHRAELNSDAPSVHIAGFHGRLGIRHNYYNRYSSEDKSSRNAVGGLVFTDKNGPFHIIGIKLDYVYSVPLDRFNFNSLSFGLGGILYSQSIRLGDVNSAWLDDPFIAENIGNKITVPDFNAGILFSHDNKFYIGFSVSQLTQNIFNRSRVNLIVCRNYYLLSGYRFETNILEIELSVAVGHNFAPKSHSNYGNFMDINLELFLKPIVFKNSFRVDGSIKSSLLYRVKSFEMGACADLFIPNGFNSRFIGVALMASYTFFPSRFR